MYVIIDVLYLPVEVDWIKFNVDMSGYYIVHYEGSGWDDLITLLKHNHTALRSNDRASLINNAFQLVRSVLIYLRTVCALIGQRDENVSEVKQFNVKYDRLYNKSVASSHALVDLKSSSLCVLDSVGKLPLDKALDLTLYLSKETEIMPVTQGFSELVPLYKLMEKRDMVELENQMKVSDHTVIFLACGLIHSGFRFEISFFSVCNSENKTKMCLDIQSK